MEQILVEAGTPAEAGETHLCDRDARGFAFIKLAAVSGWILRSMVR